jgi:threonine aldolase
MWFESGGAAFLSGVQCIVAGSGGLYDADQMEAAIKPPQYWCPRSTLVCVENTHNAAGGRIFPQKNVIAISERARARGLAVHLDGARIWNASAATGIDVKELAAPFDTISVCFSKGLGAPVGSTLVGPRLTIQEAHRLRKMWGGGMRQVGILAAGALHALHHHRARLVDDHTNAKLLAEKLTAVSGVKVANVETNIVNIDLPFAAEKAVESAKLKGLAISASGPMRLRAVTHLDASRADVERAAEIVRDVVAEHA